MITSCHNPQNGIANQPTNRKVHNLCKDPSAVPPALLKMLELGLGFCLSLNWDKTNPINSERLCRDLHIKYFVAQQGSNDSGYNPKLYVKNSDWDPPIALDNVEAAINMFEACTSNLFHHSRSLQHKFNLT